MGKNVAWSWLIACSLGAAVACGGDDDDGDSQPIADAGPGDVNAIEDTTAINTDCPDAVGPLDGKYGQKGSCCYRTSNKLRIDPDASERVYEFRTREFLLINHRTTINPDVLGSLTFSRFDNEEQSILFRFTFPQEDGKVVAKKGKIQIGPGRYNCDGTYSFYSDTAAKGDGDPARWAAATMEADVDPTKTNQDVIKPTYKTALPSKNRVSYLPYLSTTDYQVEWEGASQGFDIIEMPTGEANIDCVGSRNSSGDWKAAGKTIAYGRLDVVNTDKKIAALNVNFCQLMAFGSTSEVQKKLPNCETEPRCTPGTGCIWQRLPDSLCPTDESAGWGCHLGSDSNPDNDPVKKNCTAEAPTESSDAPTSDGQCCDPLGKDSKLPACNAWLQINEFVAAAVDITDKPANDVQQQCD